MDMSKFASKKFVGTDRLRESQIQGLMVSLEEGKFDKPVLTLSTGDRVSLNKTSVDNLIMAYGTDSNSWIGKGATLSLGWVVLNGIDKEAVIAKPTEDAGNLVDTF
jgi:hypothetical protein